MVASVRAWLLVKRKSLWSGTELREAFIELCNDCLIGVDSLASDLLRIVTAHGTQESVRAERFELRQ